MPEILIDPEISPKLAQWCARAIPHVAEGSFGPCFAIGVASAGVEDPTAELYAVIVFHDLQERARTIQLSMAARSPKWATPAVLRRLLYYPFCELGLYKLWTATPHTNQRALRFNRGIGMRQDGVLRHQFGKGTHAVVMSMLYDEYLQSRWAPARRVSRETQEAA